jgi:hypothetical protein
VYYVPREIREEEFEDIPKNPKDGALIKVKACDRRYDFSCLTI